MRCAVFFTAVFVAAGCDYAPAEKVNKLAREVEVVKLDQRVMRVELDSTVENQKSMQTSVRAIGSGFNVLTESVSEQEDRVEHLETRTSRLRQDIQRYAASGRSGLPPPVEPNLVGIYLGTRLDTKTLDETPMRLQWCEREEGTQGYLTSAGHEPDYTTLRCWRYGDVAIFRSESAKGPEVRCLRSINVADDGSLRAIDCENAAQLYTFTLR
jgi:hypothetical protein